MMINKIKIVKYEEKYKESLLDLLKYIWPNINNKEIKERFEWRYERNPYDKEPYIFLAMDNDKIAGFRAFVLQHYQIGGKIFIIFSPADTIVHEDYRRQGIISKLNTVSINFINNVFKGDRVFLTNLSTSAISMPAYLKQNWHRVNHKKTYSYKVSLKFFFTNKSNNDDTTTLIRDGCCIEISSSLYSSQLGLFVSNNRNHNKFSNIRDESFFSWKYSYQPSKYKYIYCRRDDEMIGYLIVKQLKGKRFSLEEFDATEYSIFRLMVSVVMKELSIQVLRTWSFSGRDNAWLRKSCFFTEPAMIFRLFGKERLPILVRPTTQKPSDDDFKVNDCDIRNIKNWIVFEADKH